MLNYNDDYSDHANAEGNSPSEFNVYAEKTSSHTTARSIIYLPNAPKTLNELLFKAAFEAPERGITFISDNGDENWLSFSELLLEAQSFLAGLQAKGIKAGDKLIIQINDKYKFAIAYWGAVLGGIIPAPVASSFAMDPGKNGFEKFIYIWQLLKKPYIVTDYIPEALTKALTEPASASARILKEMDAQALNPLMFEAFQKDSDDAKIFAVQPDDIAFLQFTSGSTGNPKGVILKHKNLIANIHSLAEASELNSSEIIINWMPFYHDMGLIGSFLTSILTTSSSYQMSPFAFVKRPQLLLQKISDHKITFTSTPNFGLKRILDKLSDEQLAKFDLSSLRLICNGAEPISVSLTQRFMKKLGALCGLRSDAMCPVYGMAEACLGVSFAHLGHQVDHISLNRLKLSIADEVEYVQEYDKNSILFMVEGYPISGLELRILDDKDRLLNDNQIGHIEMRGPNISSGYYNNPEATAAFKHVDGWVRTGDIGFIHDERLTLTGRSKDIIFVNGQNFYAHDLEHEAMELEEVAQVVAGGYQDVDSGLEKIVVFVVPDNKNLRLIADDKELATQIVLNKVRDKINFLFGFSPDFFIALKAGQVLKTTSGKLQRNEMIASFQKQLFKYTSYTTEQLIAIEHPSQSDNNSSNIKTANATIQLNQYELQANIELLLKEVWANILQLPISRIGLNDSFFQLGGNSIKAVEMIALAEENIGCSIAQDVISNYQTISDIANYIVSNNLQLSEKLTSVEQTDQGNNKASDTEQTANNQDNDIAIIGMSCRFPGSYNLRRFWETLTEGKDCISEIPKDRWDVEQFFDPTGQEPNKSYSKWGGFLEDIREFDADFFNISEDEAQQMDPQQRLFLEIAWLALENSGYIKPKDKKVGVYVGAGFNGYMENFINRFDTVDIHASTMTGNLTNMIAARVAHTYNLNGPALTIDTGCSSALVALHLASNSIISGECDMALVGGIQLNLSSAPYVMFSKAGALSHGQHCNAFDESADGFIPGEGAGAIIIKSYKQAVADGDRIFSVIKGSAVNNDGRSLGIMAPNPQGQVSVINEAYKKSGIDPASISYIEAHGTGSEISDLIELRSLSNVFKEANASIQQCAIGTVKNNIGHLLAASGIASVIKTSLSLYNKKLIPTINFKKEKASVNFSQSPFYINQTLKDWDTKHEKRRAGVHAFGFGGTNCHLVMEEYDQVEVKRQKPSNVYQMVTISAHHKKSFSKSIDDLKVFLANHQEHELVDICYSLNAKKSHFSDNRAVFVCNSIPHLRLLLSEFSLTKTAQELEQKKVLIARKNIKPSKNNPVFIFSGELNVFPQMAKTLYEFEPEFRKSIAHCQIIFDEVESKTIKSTVENNLNLSLASLLTEPVSGKVLESAKINQLLAFVFDYSLAQVWLQKGITPGAVLGFGVGDYVAACISDAIALDDAIKILLARVELLECNSSPSCCDAITLELECNLETFKVISQKAAYQPKIFSLNSHNSITIQCVRNNCDQIIKILHDNNIIFKYLDIHYSFNNISPIKINKFSRMLDDINFKAPITPWISSYIGDFVNSLENNKYYWIEHINSLSSFEHGIQYILDKGFTRFLEVGSSNTLSEYCQEIIDPHCWLESSLPNYKKNEDRISIDNNSADSKVVALSNGINKDFSNKQQLHLIKVMGKLYVDGLNFNWDNCYYASQYDVADDASAPSEKDLAEVSKERLIDNKGYETQTDHVNHSVSSSRGKLINIPTYPFQRKEAWIQQNTLNNDDFFNSMMKQVGLGRYTISPDKNNPIFSRLNINESLMPGIGQCELIAHSYKLAYGQIANVLDNLVFQKNAQDEGDFDIVFQQNNKQFFVIPSGEQGAQAYLSGNIDTRDFVKKNAKDIAAIRIRLKHQFTHGQIYDYFSHAGIDYGQFYQNLNTIHSNQDEVLAEIIISDENKRANTSNLHPGILDSSVQAFIGCHLANINMLSIIDNNDIKTVNCVFSPIKIDQIRMYQPLNSDHYFSHIIRLQDKNDEFIHCDIDICDVKGNVVIEIKNFTAQRIELLDNSIEENEIGQDLKKLKLKESSLNLKEFLIYCIADILGIHQSDVEFGAQFMDMNADSISALKLVKCLEDNIDIELYPTLLFEYTSVESLYDYLCTQVDEAIRIDINIAENQELDSTLNSSIEAINLPIENEVEEIENEVEESDSLTHSVFEQITSLQDNIESQRLEHNRLMDKQMESIRSLIELAKNNQYKEKNISKVTSINLANISQVQIEDYLIDLCENNINTENSVKIARETSFLEMGADSIIALSIVKDIEHYLSIELYPTLLFEYQNVMELSGYLFTEIEQKSA